MNDFRGFLHALNPVPRVRAFVSNAAARPGLTAASVIGNALLPGAGALINRVGHWGYDRQFDNSAQRNNARVGEMGNEAARSAMERPLDGALGQFEQPRGGQQNPLVQAMMGNTYGGQQALNSGAYNVQNQWAQQQPQSILGGMPQSPMPQLDLSGLDAALAARGGGQGQGGRGGNPGAGWSGVMGPGANGHMLIRGTQMFGAGGAGGSSKFYNRRGASAQ